MIVDVAHGQLAVHQRQTSWVLLRDAALAEQMKEVFAGEERLSEEWSCCSGSYGRNSAAVLPLQGWNNRHCRINFFLCVFDHL